MSPIKPDCEKITEWDLDQPEKYEIDLRRGPRITSAIESLRGNHPPSINEIGIGKDLQSFRSDGNNVLIAGEECHQLRIEEEIYDRHADEEDHVIDANLPYR